MGDAGEAQWDTIRLQRGDMLLMAATSRHHGMPALPDSQDGLQGALFNLWTPDPGHRNKQPNTTRLDPPSRGLGRCWEFVQLGFPSVNQVLWVGKGVVVRVGLWEGGAAQALFAVAPEAVPAGPPHLPLAPHLPLPLRPELRSRRHGDRRAEHPLLRGDYAPHRDLQGDNVHAESEIHFAMSGSAPPMRPTTLWHLLNTVPAWRSPKCTKAGAWSITCPCDCKVCLLVCLPPALPNWKKLP